MTNTIDPALVAEVAGRLTRSEVMAVRGGQTWSGAQRNRLIAKDIASTTCKGAPPLPRRSRCHTCSYALPLTDFGTAVRRFLQEQQP